METYEKYRRYLEVAVAVAVVTVPGAVYAAGAGAEKGGEEAAHAGFDWVGWAIQLFNFAVFAGIVLYFGLPGARKYFKGRHDDIVSDLEEAKRMRQEAEARLEEYTAKLEALEGKREEMLEEYHRQGEREKERLIEEAKEQVEKMRADAEETIDQEVRKAVASLEGEAVDLAVEMAREMARKQLDGAEQDELLEAYVRDLSEHEDVSAAR